ncbi:cytochrome P450 [Microtetraspora sp. NBRC 13810]|uniref:cytochrome P450 n=1 Tax=Microtetraspora sp. NBRC 13810 TaxID=3030990 RepID=UPI0024A0C75E|nr:cytochrome P450 [Microtetraspora sp. NBRC 13810]GLW11280.1 cytochrome P450 [Microtetraspora sp. NBRC 13810]
MITVEDLSQAELFTEALKQANRPDPYPFYKELRRRGMSRLDDGRWLVTRHREITRLLRDPRVGSFQRESGAANAGPVLHHPDGTPFEGSFLVQDPPGHDRLRQAVTQLLIPRIMDMRDHLEDLVTGLLDTHVTGRPGQIDVVADLAYPLPVTVICELLGVPREDEAIFGDYARRLTRGLDPVETQTEEELRELAVARVELASYLSGLIAFRREHPDDGLLYGLMNVLGPLDLHATLQLLLIAGHETTVNLIANGTLALLRDPAAAARLREDPQLATPLVEEVLRYDPPVQMTRRRALADIDISGVTIPEGDTMVLILAAGNRDAEVFADPDTFVPDRAGNAHLAYGGGAHYCVGASLARAEAQIAFTALARRLDAPRLVTDPPPYRDNAVLRGPERLLVSFDRLTA